MIVSLVLAGPADAAGIHLFKETFGSASQPSFTNPLSLAINQASGDVVVVQGGANEKQVVTLGGTGLGGTFKLTLATAKGLGQTTSGSNEVTGVRTSIGSFNVRDSITGTNIPPGTTVTAVGPGTMTLSANATGTGSVADLVATETTAAIGTGNTTASSKVVKNVTTTSGNFTVGQRIESAGFITAGTTTITKIINPTEFELSANATAAGSGVALSAPGVPFNVTTGNLANALKGLPGVGTAGVNVTGTAGSTYTIEFKGLFSDLDIDEMACNGSSLTGTSPTCTVSTSVAGVFAGLRRFHADGSPSNFSGLGTNLIDGRRGPGGRTFAECASEAASCDETPQGFLKPETNQGTQIAIDNSGGIANGNIYVSQAEGSLIDIFGASGKYLGQISQYRANEEQKFEHTGFSNGDEFTLGNLPVGCSASTTDPISYSSFSSTLAANVLNALEAKCGSPGFSNFKVNVPLFSPSGTVTFQGQFASQNIGQLTCMKLSGVGSCSTSTVINGLEPLVFTSSCGVGVDPSGSLYTGNFVKSETYKYTPSTNPPTVGDSVLNISNSSISNPCSFAAGVGPTAGFVFIGKQAGPIFKVDGATGALKYVVAPGSNVTEAVNPGNGRILASVGSTATEYDASGVVSPVQTSTLTAASSILGLGVSTPTGNVYVSRTGATNLEVFGPVVFQPTALLNAATEISTTKATLNGSVNAEGSPVSVCKFEYLTQAEYAANGNSYSGPNVPQAKSCAEAIPNDSSAHPVSAAVSGLKATTTYHYRLFAENGAGPSVTGDKTFLTSPTVTTGQATSVADTTATVSGTVNPVGVAFTACKFEYLTAADFALNGNGYSGIKTPQTKACTPSAASIEADFQPHAVSASLTGLAKNTTYHFRLSATNASGTVTGLDQTFLTLGQPQIVSQTAFVHRTSATLKARINPSGFATTYHFEWGTDDSYGTRVPADVDLFIGAGTSPVEVSAQISGLTENTPYHFRVVASSASGADEGEDREFVTLNSADLPDDRGAELVSPANKRPAGTVGSIIAGDEGQLLAQASEDGSSLIYPLVNGLDSSTAGGFLRERGTRTPSGWVSSQVSAPSLVSLPDRNITTGLGNPGLVLFASPDLSCAIVATFNPLTEDTPQVDVELGVYNLYRWNSDGTYELITNQVPLNPQASASGAVYFSVEASDDCERVYFKSGTYQFIAGASGIYEWDHGILRDAALLPNGIPAASAAVGGEIGSLQGARWNAVSPDGSRFFFSGISNEGPDATKRAIFMREDGGATVTDISQSQTAVPASGARFEGASADGTHVFFKANYGIASTSSAGPTNGACGTSATSSIQVETVPCDLYDYDVESGDLTDLSADSNLADANGATVQGTVALSPDGSHVYFAATGQLVPGKGKTNAENNQGLTFANIYLAHDGSLSYVTNLGGAQATTPKGNAYQVSDLSGGGTGITGIKHGAALMRNQQAWTAATSNDGNVLLFGAVGNVTGYLSGGVEEAYLYSEQAEEVRCVSCRPDGLPSVHTPELGTGRQAETIDLKSPIARSQFPSPFLAIYRARSMSEDGKRIFFTSPDVLAPGGVADAENIYEWEKGQVYFLAIARPSGGSGIGTYLDASSSGDDVFIATSEQLAPQDIDFVSDAYDLRVGGGFEPEPVAVPCDPANDECQGPPSAPPAAVTPSSATESNPGNVSGKKKKKHKKHHKKTKKGHQSRPTNSNRGGAK